METSLALHFAADFADIFEVRGMKRQARGEDLPPEVTGDRVVLGYRGLDGVVRRTRPAVRAAAVPAHRLDRPAGPVAAAAAGGHVLL